MNQDVVSLSRKPRGQPRGRALDPEVLLRLRGLLGDEAANPQLRRRDLLIEHLHAVQDAVGCLPLAWLRALAAYMKLSMAEVYETASFYAHFDVVHDDEPAPPSKTVRVCDSVSCRLAGADKLVSDLQARLNPSECRVLRAPCMGRCDAAVAVAVGHTHLTLATVDAVVEAVAADLPQVEPEGWQRLDDYRLQGGYALLESCRSGSLSFDALQSTLDQSGLRGLGGAGFPTARKWAAVRAQAGPRYCVINADEGEPGTFKDRHYLERWPHQVLEGVLVSAWAVQADAVYLYLRDEYPEVRQILLKAVAELEEAGLIPVGFIVLRRGAGAYICGEESALIESLEGKPGKPRHRPPYVSECGLFGRPTLVSNVETVYWIPLIHQRGADWFASQGRHGRRGLRSFSVSGRVKNPGVHLAPAGITLRELIDEFCGGMLDGHGLLAYLPGGASGGILPASKADIPLDFDSLQPHGCFIGSAAIIVLSDQDDLAMVARNLMHFFKDESCGQCTPCRVGTAKMLTLLESGTWNAAAMERLSRLMVDASICGLGQAAPNPVLSLLRDFRPALAACNINVEG